MMRGKKTGFSKLAVAVSVVAVIFVGLVIWAYTSKAAFTEKVNGADVNALIEGFEENGGMADNVYYGEGLSAETAKPELIIFEYADYQCPSCSVTFPYLSDLIDEYQGKVALAFRTFIMSYHENGTPAAYAANAAAKQGYWHEMALKLFKNQKVWEYEEDDETRNNMFAEYFREVSGGKGDVTQFEKDMKSESVKKKASFDQALSRQYGVTATPSVYINGKSVDFDTVKEDEFKAIIRNAINEAL